MGKNKKGSDKVNISPLQNDSFSRLFEKWCETGGDSLLSASVKDRHTEENKSRGITALRLSKVTSSIDLHGFTRQEAYDAARTFLKEEYCKGHKKVAIVTGKGLHSKDGVPVVKESVIEAIRSLNIVREYYSPREIYGGGGTIHVIFKNV